MKKILIWLLALCMALGTFSLAGCKRDGNNNGVILDPNKEVINVSLFSAGFGTEWMTNMLNDYNKTLTGNYQFNRIAENTDSIDTITDQIIAGVKKADIYFNDTSNFKMLMSMGVLLDLSEVWDYTPSGEEKTVREKIIDRETFEEAFSYEEKIYGVPFSQGMSGIIYDHDLFEDANLLAKDPSTKNGLTKGTDGIEGTFDDGLPETMEEFVKLCDTIKFDRHYWPFLYTDTVGGGITAPVLETVAGLYEGLESYKTTIVYDGNYTSPSTGTVTKVIPSEGYKTYALGEGRIKAVDFLCDVLLNTDYYDSSLQGINHTASEEHFLYSHSIGRTRVAMTLNGCWWENEAKTAFATDARRNGEKWGYGKRDFRFMPVPAIEGQSETMNGKYVFATNADGSVFAMKSEDEEKNKAMLDFIKFFVSDKGLRYFGVQTGSMPAYRFDLSEEDYNSLTPFSQNQYDILNCENTVILRPELIAQLSPINYLTANSPERWGAIINGYEYANAYDGVVRTSESEYVAALKTRYDAKSWAQIYDQIAGN